MGVGVVQLLNTGHLPHDFWDWDTSAGFSWGGNDEDEDEGAQPKADEPTSPSSGNRNHHTSDKFVKMCVECHTRRWQTSAYMCNTQNINAFYTHTAWHCILCSACAVLLLRTCKPEIWLHGCCFLHYISEDSSHVNNKGRRLQGCTHLTLQLTNGSMMVFNDIGAITQYDFHNVKHVCHAV